MRARTCYACGEQALGCIMGGSCAGCGARDTAAGRFWHPSGEQPHFREMSMTLHEDPAKAFDQLNRLRRAVAACLDVVDLSESSDMRPAVEELRGKKVRMVVALEVVDA